MVVQSYHHYSVFSTDEGESQNHVSESAKWKPGSDMFFIYIFALRWIFLLYGNFIEKDFRFWNTP